jgi:hypothetical protein
LKYLSIAGRATETRGHFRFGRMGEPLVWMIHKKCSVSHLYTLKRYCKKIIQYFTP